MNIIGDVIGRHKSEIETPALIIDLDIMDRNIAKMASYARSVNTNVRPHSKTHKCPIIAHKQIAAGAIGVTCQKLGEAEVLVAAGIKNILLASQIIPKSKIMRLVGLAKHSDIIVAVDTSENVKDLDEAAKLFNVTLNVVIEVDVGLSRAGVRSSVQALELAQVISKSRNLRFRGVMGYEGHCVFIKEKEERIAKTKAANAILIDSKHTIEAGGFPVEIVSAGGTGTYNITAGNPEITEIEPGSYVFMDAKYANIDGIDFEQALVEMGTIIGRPSPERAIIDLGAKAISYDFGMPNIRGVDGSEIVKLSEEHALVNVEGDARRLKVGDKVELVPTHGCTTINLHNVYYGIRKDIVEVIWEIPARGKFV